MPDIEYALAFDGKCIFHSTPNAFLVHKGWKTFIETWRWRYFFSHKTSDTKYLRRFHVKSDNDAPRGSDIFERGLERGKDLLCSRAAALNVGFKCMINPNITHIRSELQSSSLLVLATDNNLGIAVVMRDWYVTNVMSQLFDSNMYVALSREQLASHIGEVETTQGLLQSLKFAGKTSTNLEWNEGILLKYLDHASQRKDVAIPEF